MFNTIDSLQQFFQSYRDKIPEIAEYKIQLEDMLTENTLKKGEGYTQVESLIALYDKVYPLVEKELWSTDNFDEVLAIYQSLFREQELLISQTGSTERYDFILSIPIADRPEHLRGCLESIFQLCSLYSYGGYSSDR